MTSLLVTPEHEVEEIDGSDPLRLGRVESKFSGGGGTIRFNLTEDLWIYFHPYEYRILEMYERSGREGKKVNATAAAILLGYGYDYGKNKWVPCGDALFAGLRHPHAPVSSAYLLNGHNPISEDTKAKIMVIRNLVETSTHEVDPIDLTDFHVWQKWNPVNSFPSLAEKLKTV
jgi:hypothetical protein